MTDLKTLLRAVANGSGAEVAGYTIGSGYLVSGADINSVATMKFNEISGGVAYLYRNTVREVSDNYDKVKNATAIDEIIDRDKFRPHGIPRKDNRQERAYVVRG